ncbi:MAG: cation transporter [Calditrichaeota bacterium]|jgi:multicomponent Na+:H+ antiporter subunit E|nr:cation transporter [Calditrichota bacterium]MBT7616081.1 cation transporter [Calditrichota bacterium]MBT7788231.1 cation transporter [Calditrichota bacterium]
MTFLYTFIIMLAFWILLSGKFDIFHLTLGVISCLLVAHFSRDLIFTDKTKKGRLPEAFRFIAYIPWLLWQIVLSNLSVAYYALHPRMMREIDPQIYWFKTYLKKDIALVTLGNSITLTPGTITVRIVDDEFYVHTLHPKFTSLIKDKMEGKIARIFGEAEK